MYRLRSRQRSCHVGPCTGDKQVPVEKTILRSCDSTPILDTVQCDYFRVNQHGIAL